MREILFRAKDGCAFFANTRLVRRWAYGYLCDRNYIGEECRDEYGARYTSETLIDPGTICQYTGVEKEGVKLFENDVIECWRNGRHFQTQIEWDEDVGGFVFQDTETTSVGLDALGEGGIYRDYRIIGNIFDNPELGR